MTSTLLPVEICLLILEHVIISHPLFSTDPHVDYGGDQYDVAIDRGLTAVLETEFRKQQLVLRQVCHSWKAFVDRPEIKFRFARMLDILNGSNKCSALSVIELMQARRIEVPNSCSTFRHPKIVDDRLRGLAESVSATIAGAPGDATFKAEIITNVGDCISTLILETHPSAFPHLRFLHLNLVRSLQPAARPRDIFAKISRHFPFMTSLYFTLGVAAFTSADLLRLRSLRTLVITSRHRVEGLPFDQWSLPSLFHLKLGKLKGIEEFRSLLAALPQLGHQLKVLDVESEGIDEYDDEVMANLWGDCPKLENLRIPLSLLITHLPSHGRHPLRYLVNSDLDPVGICWLAVTGWLPVDFTSTLISFCQAFPNLLVVRDNHDWNSVRFQDLGNTIQDEANFELKHDQESCRCMVETVAQMNTLNIPVRFEDENRKVLGEL